MNTVEWADLASVPVYPLAILRRIDSSVRKTTLRHTPGAHRTTRTVRRELGNAVAAAYPGSLDEVRIQLLPALRAAILVPVSVGHDLRGTPVPALVLDAMLRVRRMRRTGGIRRYYATTYRGYDRYVTSPAGLLTCGHVDTVPPGATLIDTCQRPRHDTLRSHRPARIPLNAGDRAALVIVGVALFVHLTPEGSWIDQIVSPDTAATDVATPEHPATSANEEPLDMAGTFRDLTGIIPDFTLRSIRRTESGYQLTGHTDHRHTDSTRLAALPGVTAVQISTTRGRTEIHIQGEE